MRLTALVGMLLSLSNAPMAEEPQKPRAVPVQSECIRTGKQILIHVSITTRSTGKEAKNWGLGESRTLYQFNCFRDSKRCDGVSLNLDPIEAGKPLNLMNLNRLDGAKLVSNNGQSAVIVWGVNQFVVDFEKGLVTYTADNQLMDGSTRGEGACAVSVRP